MKRRNFFAFVPSLFAAPLVAKEIIQEKEAITLIKPEPIKIEKPSLTSFDMSKCRVQVIYEDEQVIGEGYLTELTIDSPLSHFGAPTILASAQLYNFHL